MAYFVCDHFLLLLLLLNIATNDARTQQRSVHAALLVGTYRSIGHHTQEVKYVNIL